MNATEFALKLIQDYNAEHNRYRRGRAAVSRLQADQQWHSDAIAAGIASYYSKTPGLSYKEALNTFLDRTSSTPTDALFVSSGVKSGKIRRYNNQLKKWQASTSVYAVAQIKRLEDVLDVAKKSPVNAELGKKWQQLVSAKSTADRAYKSRWQVRCAITAFNKLNSGIKIKFGNCGRGGGSMSYINHVVVDGGKIKLAKFLDNALFETAILNS